jgi:ABC-type glycerol-3-phosphate transport system substrate-binding protein
LKIGLPSARTSSAITRTTIVIIVVAIIVVAAIGGYLFVSMPSRPAPSTATTAAAPVTLEYWQFGGIDTEHVYMDKIIAQWNAANPGIQVVRTEKDWGTKFTILQTALAAGAAPDIVSLDTSTLPDLLAINAYLPLSKQYPSDWATMSTNFDPTALKTVYINGTYWGFPTYIDAGPFLAINTDMFKKAGLVDAAGNAKFPASWSEVVTDAQKIQSAGLAKWGLIFPANVPYDAEQFENLAYQNGGRWLSADGKTVTINTPGWVDALQFYSDLVRKYNVSPASTDNDYMKAIELFFSNQTGMAIGYSWVPAIQAAINVSLGFPWTQAPFPPPNTVSGPAGSVSMLMSPGTTFYIISQTKHPQEALTFYKWLCNTIVQDGGWGPSTAQGIWRVPSAMKSYYDVPQVNQMWPDVVASYKAGTLFTGAVPEPAFRGYVKMESAYLLPAIQAVVLGTDTPKSALDKANAQAQTYLDSLGGATGTGWW